MSQVNVSNLGFGGTGIPDALPKAIAELQGLKANIVTGDAGGTLVPLAGMDPEDHIVAVLNLTDLTEVDVATITIATRNALATITCLATAVDGDTVVVAGKTYTFKDIVVHPSYNAPPGIIPMTISGSPEESDPEELATRLANAIMSNDSRLTATVGDDESSPVLQAKVTVTVREAGVAGNAFTLTEVGTAVTVSGATFTGGAEEASEQGFSSSESLSAKKLLVLWFAKNYAASAANL